MLRLVVILILFYVPHTKTATNYDYKVHGFLVNEVYTWDIKRDGMRRIVSAKPKRSMTQVVFYDKDFKGRGYFIVRKHSLYKYDDNLKILTLVNQYGFKRIKYTHRFAGVVKSFYDVERNLEKSKLGRLNI